METMIDIIDVSKSYGKGLPAVNHANLHVDKGEFVFVVGSSGSGKTTLIKLLMKELDSTSGQMIVSGERLEKMKHRRVAKYRRKLGVVFQDFRLLNILLADEPTGNLDPKTSEEIMKLLEQINERGTTVLVVTHNKEIVNAMKKRVVTMHDGVIVSDEKEGEYHEA